MEPTSEVISFHSMKLGGVSIGPRILGYDTPLPRFSSPKGCARHAGTLLPLRGAHGFFRADRRLAVSLVLTRRTDTDLVSPRPAHDHGLGSVAGLRSGQPQGHDDPRVA